jgi:hypothetical protein
VAWGSRRHEIQAAEDRGSGGKGEKREVFLETLMPSRILKNPWHRAFLTSLERALWKHRIKYELFGWASTLFGQKVQKNRNQTGPPFHSVAVKTKISAQNSITCLIEPNFQGTKTNDPFRNFGTIEKEVILSVLVRKANK